MLFDVQCTELEENKGRLQIMSEEQEKNRRLQLLSQEKVKKDVDSVRKQLQLERSLKLNAFQCLEDLRAEVGVETGHHDCVCSGSQGASMPLESKT